MALTTLFDLDGFKGKVDSDRFSAKDILKGLVKPAEEFQVGERDVPMELRTDTGSIYGYNVSDKPGSKKYFPRLASAHLNAMMAGTDEVHFSELSHILSSLFDVGSEQWFDYLAVRVAQRKELPDGTGEYTVVPNTFPPYMNKGKPEAEGTKVKKYDLVQFFNDSHVSSKYGLSTKFINTVQLLAITDPASAAMTVQEKVQDMSPTATIVVSPGAYSMSLAQCTRRLLSAASKAIDYQGSSISVFAGDSVFIYEPGKTDADKEAWHVWGPQKLANVVYAVYRMVLRAGRSEISVLYAMELVKTGIHIMEGTEDVATTFIGNVGDASELDFAPLRRSVVMGTVQQDLAVKLMNCYPVMVQDRTVATAVRVSDSYVLVNSHVLEGVECTMNGHPLVGGMPLGQDLWAFNIPGDYEPWTVRQPRAGDKVIMAAFTSDHVALSSDFRIDKVDGFNFFSKRIPEVAAGASGAAVISLEDGALLGIHSGLSGHYMLGLAFSPSMQSDLREWQADNSCALEQRRDASETVVAELQKHGAHHAFQSVVNGLQPVHSVSGVYLGTALCLDCKLFTTLPPGDYNVGALKEPTTFYEHTGQYSVAYESTYISELSPVLTRSPEVFESVVIVGTDSESPFTSRVTTVRQVPPGKRSFMLAATEGNVFPLSGGVVVSLQDGAVLGSFVRDSSSTSVGRLSLCTSVVRDVQAELQDNITLLSKKFPALNVRSWPPGVVDEVFTHPSMQLPKDNLALARVGDTAARAALFTEVRRIGFTENPQQLLQKLQTNSVLAELCWKLGIASMLRHQPGISFPASSKAYADLVEGLLGAVYIYETPEVFLSFCRGIGVVPIEKSSPRMLRRGSSFADLQVTFTAVDPLDDTALTPVE